MNTAFTEKVYAIEHRLWGAIDRIELLEARNLELTNRLATLEAQGATKSGSTTP